MSDNEAAILAHNSLSIENFTTRGAAETFALGAQFGARLSGGEIVLLNGTLGAGKTVFTKGLASSLGIAPEEVTSPTFTLVNRYNGRLTVYHLDLYRLEAGTHAAHHVDMDGLLDDTRAVIVIEWAERLAGYPLPTGDIRRISFSSEDDTTRHIEISMV